LLLLPEILTILDNFPQWPCYAKANSNVSSNTTFSDMLPMTTPPTFRAIEDKIVSPQEAAQQCQELKTQGSLVFTNGVFDVLHKGHVTYLEKARRLGDHLIVALNTDASAKRLGKGPERPLNALLDRAHVVAALQSVSLVTWFDEDTPLQIIQTLQPNVLVKGGDYDMDALAEAQWVRSQGGLATTIPFVSGYSTTRLVKLIQSTRA
jgi:cytidyltransferase-like protein